MLNVDPAPALVGRVEIQASELRAARAVRRPAADAFILIEQIAVLVQIIREPDVVVAAAVPVFDDVDVAVVVNTQIVRAVERCANCRTRREIDGVSVREH